MRIGICLLAVSVAFAATAGADVLKYVDPFIGTSGTGHTTPAAAYPLGLVQAGPDTGRGDWKYCSGYQFGDTNVVRFSQTHLSGTGCPDLGDLGLMPFVGASADAPAAKADETATPGFYAVTLKPSGIRVEIAAAEHSAIYRVTYPVGAEAKVLVDPNWCVGYPEGGWRGRGITNVVVKARKDGIVTCSWHRQGWVCRDVYAAIAFSAPAKGLGGGVFSFGALAEAARTIEVCVALSSRSIEGACRNLAAELRARSFDEVRVAAAEAWRRRLSCVEAKGTDAQLTAFYTSLYHLFFQPNNIADVGERPSYSTLSCWDTFRAAHPLYTIVAPEMVDPLVATMVEAADKTGFLPIWTLWGLDNQCMIGTHSIPVIVDAYLKGFRGFDAERAWRAIERTRCEHHANREKEAWDVLDAHGYYPVDVIKGESVSRTLEVAYDDACAARFAKALGKDDREVFYATRGAYWKNVFDAATGFARPRLADGSWREPFDPFKLGWESGFTEGNAWQYTWHVMQDPEGLIAALGGREKALAKLQALFEQPSEKEGAGKVVDVTGLIGQYAHGNEPSHHVIYLFLYLGRPDLTAKYVREVFATQYGITPDGLCGNDDCGQMSAWYVFSAMGFYPLDPCGGDYVLGAPQVPRATIRLPGGKSFTIRANNLSKENLYVKSVSLNGRPKTDFILRHADILAGGELAFEMTDKIR